MTTQFGMKYQTFMARHPAGVSGQMVLSLLRNDKFGKNFVGFFFFSLSKICSSTESDNSLNKNIVEKG